MTTKILKINPQKPNKDKIDQAAKIIKNGGLVAFPTETVYGLGANIFNKEAIKNIFRVKERPMDDPLIVHIAEIKDLDKLTTNIPTIALKLAKKFWPGPLTMVLNKSGIVSDYVTGGLDTVAIRMPKNKIAFELIKTAETPLAAPSANKFTRPSPTIAKHVLIDLSNKIPLIIDGGQTDIGIESTVLDLTSKIPTILRPGKITEKDLKKVLRMVKGPQSTTSQLQIRKSPGTRYKHYSPNARVILVYGKITENLINRYKKSKQKIGTIKANKNINFLTKNLFKKFRELDNKKTDIILVENVEEKGLGIALMNRLKKSASEIIKN